MKDFMLDLICWVGGATLCIHGIDDKVLAVNLFGLWVTIYKSLLRG